MRRRWWVPALAVVLAALAVLVFWADKALPGTGKYKAEHTIALIADARLDDGNKQATQASLQNSVRLFRSPELVATVAEDLDFEGNPDDLASQLVITLDKASGRIAFTATGADRSQVKLLADTYAVQAMGFQQELEQERYEANLEGVTEQITSLQGALDALTEQLKNGQTSAGPTRDGLAEQLSVFIGRQTEQIARGAPASRFTTWSEASPRFVPAQPGAGLAPQSPAGRLALAVPLALVLATALVLALDRFDTRLRTKSRAEEISGLPVLVEVPLLARRHSQHGIPETADNPTSAFAEAHHILRSAILLAPSSPRLVPAALVSLRSNGDASTVRGGGSYRLVSEPSAEALDVKVIVVVSPGIGEGRSTTVANLAASFATTGRSVLVVNCDLRRPAIERMLGVDNGPGVSDFLLDPDSVPALASIALPTSVPGVRLVTSGAPVANPSGLMAGAREAISRGRDAADIIVVDTPPALLVNDAAELMSVADAVVVVARAGVTTSSAVLEISGLLSRLNVPVLGVAFTAVGGASATDEFSRSAWGVRAGALTGNRASRRTAEASEVPSVVGAGDDVYRAQ